MIYGITYSDHNMSFSRQKCADSMRVNGVDRATEYAAGDIDDEFYEFNKSIMSSSRGCGYWLWKPYVIYKEMQLLNDGDILIYSDAGVEFVNNVSHIIERMDEDMFLFTNGFPHVEWCKGDVIDNLLGWISREEHGDPYVGDNVLNFKQVQASVIFFRVNQKTRGFVKEWLLYCQMPGLIDDSPSKLPNYPTFAEHRHDQAILTCLQIQYQYKLHWWPTAYSEHIRVPGDTYPVMFNHHRKRDPGKGDGQPEW